MHGLPVPMAQQIAGNARRLAYFPGGSLLMMSLELRAPNTLLVKNEADRSPARVEVPANWISSPLAYPRFRR